MAEILCKWQLIGAKRWPSAWMISGQSQGFLLDNPQHKTKRRTKVNRTICDEHEWVVYSTAINNGWLMLQCVTCGLHGVVTDPTEEEWAVAFNAPTHPYVWTDCDRIAEKSVGPLQVAKEYRIRNSGCEQKSNYRSVAHSRENPSVSAYKGTTTDGDDCNPEKCT